MDKLIPPELRPYILPFNWEVRQVWPLEAAILPTPIADLELLLEKPFWSRTPRQLHFDLRPHDVLSGRVPSAYHEERIARADTRYPLDFIRDDGRLFILDGIHRLARLWSSGVTTVDIRAHSMAIRSAIEVQRLGEEEGA